MEPNNIKTQPELTRKQINKQAKIQKAIGKKPKSIRTCGGQEYDKKNCGPCGLGGRHKCGRVKTEILKN